MPRPKRQTPEGPTAIVASAARMLAGRRKNLPSGTSAWQAEVWDMLDTVGELEFYREWISNALSRCTLEVVYRDSDGSESAVGADTEPGAVLQALFDGDEGQADMLGMMGGHVALVGETWLCGLLAAPETADAPDLWRVLSHAEVSEQGNRWAINRGDGQPETYAQEEVYMARLWRPHPKTWVEAHSSVRSALPILRELVGLSKRTAAAIDSRLTGAGLLVMPTEMTFNSPATPDDDGSNPEQDPFMATLSHVMVTSIEDPGSAASLVPILVKAKGEHLDKIRHITFSTALDDKAPELRSELIKRLAASLDVPAEVLLGMANVNHWTGWLLDENAIKMHVEPLLATLASALTSRYLLPCLQGTAESLDPEMRRYRIRGSTEELRQRPNRSAEAQTGHAAMTINDEAWAREVGFEKDDLLTPQSPEFRTRVLMRLAQTSPDPAVVVGALSALGVTVDLPVPADPDPGAVPAVEPATPTDPRDLPELPDTQQAAALLASAEVLCLRAVERGWNKAGRRGSVRRPVPADQLDTVLADAWASVPRIAHLHRVPAATLHATLDTYARGVLASGAEHQPEQLLSALVRDVLSDTPEALLARST